ncbi:MAG: hypothetical protein FD130_2479, partial [Halothiobacillaceae bacterium]
WSDHFRQRFAGVPLKSVLLTYSPAHGSTRQQRGDLMITPTGIEGGTVYALSAPLRDEIERTGHAELRVDLMPDRSLAQLTQALARPRGSHSLAKHLQRSALTGVKAALLRELLSPEQLNDMRYLATAVKALSLPLTAPRPLQEAISTAGGLCFSALDERLMVRHHPGLFCAGEMLDWEAPTGGYLLTACFASGYVAGQGAAAFRPTLPAFCTAARPRR